METFKTFNTLSWKPSFIFDLKFLYESQQHSAQELETNLKHFRVNFDKGLLYYDRTYKQTNKQRLSSFIFIDVYK